MKEIKRKCMVCNCDYTHPIGTKYSKDIKEYCKYLGCCKKECYYKKPREERNELMWKAFLHNLDN
jgi:hypothetical protein